MFLTHRNNLRGSLHTPWFFSIRSKHNDQDSAYLETVYEQTGWNFVLTSPDKTYPYDMMSLNGQCVSYQFVSPGVAKSFSQGTLKDFISLEFNTTFSYTVESSGQVPLQERENYYRKLLISFIENFPKSD